MSRALAAVAVMLALCATGWPLQAAEPAMIVSTVEVMGAAPSTAITTADGGMGEAMGIPCCALTSLPVLPAMSPLVLLIAVVILSLVADGLLSSHPWQLAPRPAPPPAWRRRALLQTFLT